VGIVLFVVAGRGKVIGVALPALLSLRVADAILLGISMIPRAEIALVVVYQCSQFGERVVPAPVLAGMVLVSLATSITSPMLLRRLLGKSSQS
jgi:Kef-type K+ transport system membrane component KefB